MQKWMSCRKLPHPTTVKGIRSFLGHAGFYRRFIQDFSKIARPMTHLLEKETPFIFSKECIEAFETLKMKLTQAPILVAPDWDLPFENHVDASDFAVGNPRAYVRPSSPTDTLCKQNYNPSAQGTLHYNGKRITCRVCKANIAPVDFAAPRIECVYP
ncbi:reverse transcriptase domain-containing protein [Tanacetum coccineum]|uniref:Reverse transcriptase domain-containing protein n=1 Tax=Tanacetum coccineum TaxID=301880 RepID=A0ABQ4ZNV2_9ASTR